jgi:hypothetical protein
MPSAKAIGFFALVVTAVAGLWAGGTSPAFAAACTGDAATFTPLPANAACSGGTITFQDGNANTMALSTGTYGNTQFSLYLSTNYRATIGVGMTDAYNGYVIAFVPQGTNMTTGIYFSKRINGVDNLLASIVPWSLPQGGTATILIAVSGQNIYVYVNGALAAVFSDSWLPAGKIGVGLDAVGSATSNATFWNIILGPTTTVTATTAPGYCYDQWGNPVGCNCYGAYSYNCYCGAYNVCSYCYMGGTCNCYGMTYNYCGNCGSYSCGSCAYGCASCGYAFGSPACQCYSATGYPVSCNCYDGTGNYTCGCDYWSNNNTCCQYDQYNWNYNQYNNWNNQYWMYSKCKMPQSYGLVCDGPWTKDANGIWHESCF